jgi:hypothetical protein
LHLIHKEPHQERFTKKLNRVKRFEKLKQKTRSNDRVFLWCLQESNQGHMDFQSIALPTELRHLANADANIKPYLRLDNNFFRKITHFLFLHFQAPKINHLEFQIVK